jgi:RimJ/RimL family protein N-acetyltransferase
LHIPKNRVDSGVPNNFTIQYGLDEATITLLSARSTAYEADPDLFRFADDSIVFGTEDKVCAWHEEEGVPKFPFVCTANEGKELAAIIWYAQRNPPIELPLRDKEGWDSISMRSYPPYRGKGLMVPFGKETLHWHHVHRPEQALWLKVDAESAPAQALYRKLGFVQAGETTELYRDNERTKLIMTHDSGWFETLEGAK